MSFKYPDFTTITHPYKIDKSETIISSSPGYERATAKVKFIYRDKVEFIETTQKYTLTDKSLYIDDNNRRVMIINSKHLGLPMRDEKENIFLPYVESKEKKEDISEISFEILNFDIHIERKKVQIQHLSRFSTGYIHKCSCNKCNNENRDESFFATLTFYAQTTFVNTLYNALTKE